MLPLRYTRRWQMAGVVAVAGVFIAALMPSIWPSAVARLLSGTDKWQHGVTFLVLALWFSGQYSRHSYWRVAAGLLAFGVIIELCQRMLTYRDGDLLDLAADVVGIVIGLAIAVAGVGGWSLRAEAWLQRRQQKA